MANRLADDLRWLLDPAIFAHEALGITPDDWQRRVLNWTGKRLILNITRQGGKSTITSALATHQALYRPGSLTLLISPSERQSGELFRKVTGHLATLTAPPKRLEDNKLSLQLENGSRVVSLPSSEKTIRGFSAVDLLIEDEASRVPDDLYKATRPMLAVSDGRHVLMSTPFGQRGHFYDVWTDGGATWERVKIPATECPRISPAFLAEEQRSMGAMWFASEYQCEFTETVNSIFTHEMVAGAFSDEVKPLFGAGDPLGALSEGAHPALFPRLG